MKRVRKLIPLLFAGALLAALGVFAFFSLQYRLPLGADTQAVRSISDVTYETETGETGILSLPGSLSGLAPRTAVTLSAQIQAQPGDSLLIKSVFAPVKLYLNDILMYEYGQEDSYPLYLNDPPTGLAVVELPEEGGTFSLRAEYQSLTQRSTLSLPAFYIGGYAALLGSLFHANGASLLFSLILIFLGLAMSMIALTIVKKLPSGRAFLWLGLFSLSAGVWIFGECDLSAFFVPFPSLLYAMTYAGLFCVTIPMLRFGLLVLNPRNRWPFTLMLILEQRQAPGAADIILAAIFQHVLLCVWLEFVFGNAVGEGGASCLDRRIAVVDADDDRFHTAHLPRLCLGPDFRLLGRITGARSGCAFSLSPSMFLILSTP